MDTLNYQSADIFSGQLPFSLEAEQSVLGAILIDSSCLPRVMDFVKPESFFIEKHRLIFEIMLTKFTASQVIDIITVLDAVKNEGIFQTPEDAKIYLAQLAQVVPSTSHIESYAKILQEKYYVRSLILTAKDIIDNSNSPGAEAANLIDSAEQSIFEIRQGRETRGLIPISQIIMSTYDTLQKISGDDKAEYIGTPSGFSALDSVITGLNKSDLILVAARPAMGKTSFALNIATNVATKTNKKVAIFSLEMGREQIVTRMLSSEALVQSNLMRTGNLKQEDWIKLAMSAQILAKAPIYLDDTPSITVAEMKGKLRRIKDLGLVVIDYLQLMTSGGRRNDNRVQEVAEITRSLKIMAKELNVPVITLSQLSRGPDSRTDHRPVLSDLRESGSIEQDADIVLFLYRDAYYNQDSEEHNVAECIVSKNRHGETGTVKLGWDGQFTRFKSMELFRNEPQG